MSLKFTISIQNDDSLTYADDIFVPKLEGREGNFKKMSPWRSIVLVQIAKVR